MSARAVPDVRDAWDAPPLPQAALPPVLIAAPVAALLVAVLVWVLAGPVVALALVVLVGVAAALWISTRGRAVLRDAGATDPEALGIEARRIARLRNVTAGLAADLSVHEPKLWISAAVDVNALVTWARGGHLVVTRGLVEGLTRTEMEAVVAHCLVRLKLGEVRRTTALTALGVAPAPSLAAASALDVRAAALTLYPPGLAAALDKASTRSGPSSGLWFVSDDTTRRGRIAALGDL